MSNSKRKGRLQRLKLRKYGKTGVFKRKKLQRRLHFSRCKEKILFERLKSRLLQRAKPRLRGSQQKLCA